MLTFPLYSSILSLPLFLAPPGLELRGGEKRYTVPIYTFSPWLEYDSQALGWEVETLTWLWRVEWPKSGFSPGFDPSAKNRENRETSPKIPQLLKR